MRAATVHLARFLAALALAWASGQASAQTNTMGVVSATLASAPSCISYRVTGVCFFLRCTPFGCTVETSIRVSHYMPDVVVSTFNDQYIHPWRDVGGAVSTIGDRVGSAMLRSPLDASGNTGEAKQSTAEPTTNKNADAIGNPVVLVNNVGTNLVVPGVTELMNFPSTLPQIMREWATAPASLITNVPSEVLGWMTNPSTLLNTVTGASNLVGGMMPDIGSMSPTASSTGNQSSFQGQLQQFKTMLDGAAASGGDNDLLCPSSADAFGVYFQSDADSYFWRSMIPLDLLYVGSWLPGYREVSQTGGLNTWGSIYPRQGQLVQQHPVKASAVFAKRVSTIILNPAQPHIYSRLRGKSPRSYVWFAQVADPKFSMVYPLPSGCTTFGENDSVSLVSYGDGRTTPTNGHVWNMWTRYECCKRKTEIFLFAVP
jgi:integrating conjugative element protein (TIGR03756 family)